jgi:hypothetical protein
MLAVLALVALIVFVGCPTSGSQNAAIWNKKIDGANGEDVIYSMAINSKDDVFVAGAGEDLLPQDKGFDWWMNKYDQFGNLNVSIRRGAGSDDRIRAIAIDSQDRVYAVGSATDAVNSISGRDWWIRRFDSTLADHLKWDRKIGVLEADAALDVTITKNDNVFIVGYGSNLITQESGADWWIKRFYTHGAEDLTWDKRLDIAGADDKARAVEVDSKGNVYVAGAVSEENPPHHKDWYIKKYEPDGTEIVVGWSKRIDQAGFDDVAYDIAIDSHDNVYVAGSRTIIDQHSNPETQAWIKKFAPTGTEKSSNWDKAIQAPGGFAKARAIEINSNDEVFVLMRGSQVLSNAVGGDFWTKKFTAKGVEQTKNWDIAGGTQSKDYPFALAIDSNGDVYVGGSAGAPQYSSTEFGDWYIEKY